MAWAWRRYTETGLAEGPRLGATRYHELRYESLVREPESELGRVCEFGSVRVPELCAIEPHPGLGIDGPVLVAFQYQEELARLRKTFGNFVALDNIDEVIKIIREEDEPKAELIRHFELTDVQAQISHW